MNAARSTVGVLSRVPPGPLRAPGEVDETEASVRAGTPRPLAAPRGHPRPGRRGPGTVAAPSGFGPASPAAAHGFPRGLLAAALAGWLVFLIPGVPRPARAAAVPSQIRSVVVFPDGAEVVRAARGSVEKGEALWVIGPLPPHLRPESLRVEVVEGSASVVDVSLRKEYETGPVTPREQELTDRIDVLGRKIDRLDDRITALKDRLGFIRSIVKAPPSETRKQEPEAWRKAWVALGDGVEETLGEIRDAGYLKQGLEAERDALRKELEDLRTGRRETYLAEIRLLGLRSGSVTLSVTYRVANASWEPSVAARLVTEAPAVELETFAGVRQQTGEDWTNAEVAVSTARSDRPVQPPPVRPWFVDLAEAVSLRRGQGPRGAGAPDLEAVAAKVKAAAPEAAPEIRTESAVTVYRIAGPVSIPSDGRIHRYPLERRRFSASVFVRAVPQRSPAAYVMARFTYEGEGIVPAGRVSVFRGPHFVGRRRAGPLRPGESVAWAFGIDDQVEVRLRKDRSFKERAGLFGGRRRVERRRLITVRNLHARPVSVEVLAMTPVSQDERLKVSLEGTTKPREESYEGTPGVIAWRRILDAHGEQTFVLQYALEFPKDTRPVGF